MSPALQCWERARNSASPGGTTLAPGRAEVYAPPRRGSESILAAVPSTPHPARGARRVLKCWANQHRASGAVDRGGTQGRVPGEFNPACPWPHRGWGGGPSRDETVLARGKTARGLRTRGMALRLARPPAPEAQS